MPPTAEELNLGRLQRSRRLSPLGHSVSPKNIYIVYKVHYVCAMCELQRVVHIASLYYRDQMLKGDDHCDISITYIL